MANATGLVTYGDYSTGTPADKMRALRGLLPTLDSGGNIIMQGFFDEMSAAAAAQLYVEIDSLIDSLTALAGAEDSGAIVQTEDGHYVALEG